MTDKLKGGAADNMTLNDVAKKVKTNLRDLKKQMDMGVPDEMEHTDDPEIAKEITKDHLSKDPKYYSKEKKMEKEEPKEQTMSGSSGAFSAPLGDTPVIKRPIQGISEETGSGVSAGSAYDVSFSSSPKHKDPLKIDGVKSIDARAHYMNKKKLPKWGGPGGVFIKIKEKCKKFPYCNQGDIHAIQYLHESIVEVSKESGLPINEVEKIVLKGIREIFI